VYNNNRKRNSYSLIIGIDFQKLIGGRVMFKKIVALLVSTFLIAGVFTGCTSTPSKTASTSSTKSTASKLIFFNGAVGLVDYYNAFFKTYNSTNKDGITVNQEYQSDATNNLQVRMAAGDVPDIINANPTQDMIDAHEFVDLSDMSWWSELSPEMKTYSVDVKSGKEYKVPLLQSFVGLFYNKTIFTACGITPANTWADFVSNLKVIKAKYPNVVPFYMGAKDGWMLQQMSNFTMQSPALQKLSYADQQKAMQGGNLASLGWDTTANGAIATFAADLMELKADGLINSNIVTATYDNQTTAFASGQAAIMGNGLWAMSVIASKNKDTSFVGLSQYPSMMDGVKPAIGCTTDGSLLLSAQSKNIAASEKVLAYMMQPDNLKSLSVQNAEPSSNPKVVSNWGSLSSDAATITANTGIAKLNWSWSPSGFSGDQQGSMIQALFAGAYKAPTDFATAWVSAYNKGLGK
jgi:raffinose/stachyose/melibiose transport system substrate-binding protein